MKRTDLPSYFGQLVSTTPYVTLATTCLDGKPWNTPVVGFFDEDCILYWASWTKSQHSLNIACEPHIFVVVYDTSLPLGQGAALYLRMHARMLHDEDEVSAAMLIYTDRFGEDGSHAAFLGECPRRLYKAAPLQIWCNTDGARGGHFVDKRQLIWQA